VRHALGEFTVPGIGYPGDRDRRQGGSWLPQADQVEIHWVSAYGNGLGLVLGQQRVVGKSSAIAAIPELLDALWFKGTMVTIGRDGLPDTDSCSHSSFASSHVWTPPQ
jgi:hypothetical protein